MIEIIREMVVTVLGSTVSKLKMS